MSNLQIYLLFIVIVLVVTGYIAFRLRRRCPHCGAMMEMDYYNFLYCKRCGLRIPQRRP